MMQRRKLRAGGKHSSGLLDFPPAAATAASTPLHASAAAMLHSGNGQTDRQTHTHTHTDKAQNNSFRNSGAKN